MVITLAIGLIGSLSFVYLKLPLPWVIGALFTTTTAAILGIELWIPKWLRANGSIVIGALFGTAVSPEFVEQFVTWLPSMIGVTGYVLVVTPSILYYLIKVAKFDLITAYFSAAPGGLLAMTLLGDAMGADAKAISLMQSTRVVLTVLIIPVSFTIFTAYEPTGQVGTGGSFESLSLTQGVILVLGSILGFLVAHPLKIPTPYLMGPMIAVGILSMLGISTAEVPDSLVAIAQWVMGSSIGTMFNRVRPKVVGEILLHGLVTSIFMVLLAVVAAVVTQRLTGLPMYGLILAFAPGGFTEMSLVGFALGIDITFLITHQLVRYFFVILMVPICLPLVRKISEPR